MEGKKLLALSLIATMVFSSVGCSFLGGGTSSSGSSSSEKDSSSKKPITKIEIDEGDIEPGELTPAYVFTNNMVLQRGKEVNIYGGGGLRGSEVTVTFNGQTKSANPERNGAWCVTLDPMEANAEGQTLTISDEFYEFTYENVVVGEVWYCSGQSNMDQYLGQILNDRGFSTTSGYENSPLRDYTKYTNWDQVRYYMQPYNQTEKPHRWGLKNEKYANGWATPQNMQEAMPYSAYAMGFALKVQEALDVPVGIVLSARHGSSIVEWLSEETIAENELEIHYSEGTFQRSQRYNGMTFALNNYTVAGFLWYQGCTDSQNVMVPYWYEDMKAFVAQFRKAHGDVPFISQSLVQHNAGAGSNWSLIRQANWDLMNEVDGFYAVNGIAAGRAYDTEVPEGFNNYIHAADKYKISTAAAEIALTYVYEESGYNGLAAYPVEVKKNGTNVEIVFEAGVQLKLSEGSNVHNLEGYDGKDWVAIENATVNGNKIILPGGAKYSKVRYGCYNVMMPGAAGMYALSSDYMVNLFTEKAGCSDLAVAPFRELDVK